MLLGEVYDLTGWKGRACKCTVVPLELFLPIIRALHLAVSSHVKQSVVAELLDRTIREQVLKAGRPVCEMLSRLGQAKTLEV